LVQNVYCAKKDQETLILQSKIVEYCCSTCCHRKSLSTRSLCM